MTVVGLKSVDCVDQSDGRDLDEVLVWRSPAGIPLGDVLREREVAGDQFVPDLRPVWVVEIQGCKLIE